MKPYRSHRSLIAIFVAFSLIIESAPTATAAEPADVIPGEIIVKFRPGTPDHIRQAAMGRVAARFRTFRHRRRGSMSAAAASAAATFEDMARVSVKNGTTSGAAIRDLLNSGWVEYAEPNYRAYAAETLPNDTNFSLRQWALRNTGQTGGTAGEDMDAGLAWDYTTGSSSVVVAVIDSGADLNHPDLAANLWTNPGEIAGNGVDDDGNGYIDDIYGWDFANADSNPQEDYFHGTHVSGIIGAVGNNGTGVAGVNWTVRIMPLKFLNSVGTGSTADAIAAIQYATAHGAHVINNSWVQSSFSNSLQTAINAARSAGIVVTGAAGNSNTSTFHYPAAMTGVIGVSAVDHNGARYTSSNFGSYVDVTAPGVSIYSTSWSAGSSIYENRTGTSMACAQVSGVAALLKAFAPSLTGAQIESIITDPANNDDLGAPGYDTFFGNGRVNMRKAILAVPDGTPPTVNVTNPAHNATVNGLVTVTASASDNIAVTQVQFLIDNVLQATDTTSPYSFDWDTTGYSNAAHSVRARAFDAAGNNSASTISVNVNNDLTPPTVALTQPADGATLSGIVEVEATAADNEAVARVEFRVNGTLKATDTTAPYSFTWNTRDTENGARTIEARAFDINANSAADSVGITLDNDFASPTVSLTQPANHAIVSGVVPIAATASDNVGVTRVDFLLDGSLIESVSAAPYAINWDSRTVLDGLKSLRAAAYDAAGNSADHAISISVSNDLTPPAIAVTHPDDATTVGGTVTVTAEASDDVAVAKVEFRIDGVLRHTDMTAPYTFDWDTRTAGNDVHTVSARAYDHGANQAIDSVNVTVFNDLVSPQVAITSPAPGAAFTGPVTISVFATDDVLLQRLELYVDGGLYQGINAVGSESAYDFIWTPSAGVFGDHAFEVKAIDASGNASTAKVSVTFRPASAAVPQFKNIFNPARGESMTVPFTVAGGGNVEIRVYDREGQESRILLDESRGPGSYADVTWDGRNGDGSNVAPGVYTLYFNIAGTREMRKAVVVR